MASFNDDSPVGKHFKLRDIIKTSYSVNNTPTESDWITIRDKLGPFLDMLWDKIGPFIIMSGYRSAALQQALRDSNEPAAAGKSFHELGLAVDIYPVGKSINDYFGEIIGQPSILNQCGECAIKPTQNTIHVSAATPSKVGVAMIMGPADSVYRRLTEAQWLQYAKSPAGMALIPVAVLTVATLAFFFVRVRPRLIANQSPA